MLEHVDIPETPLYDGLESGLYERIFTLPVDGITFSVGDLDERPFGELRADLGDAAFQRVIADAGIRLDRGTYRGADDLPLDFLVRGGCLFVFAIGEISAGRFGLTLQGAWRIA